MMKTFDCAQAKGYSINKIFIPVDDVDDGLSTYAQSHPGKITIARPAAFNNSLMWYLMEDENMKDGNTTTLPGAYVLDKQRQLVWSSQGGQSKALCEFWNLPVATDFQIDYESANIENVYVGDTFKLKTIYTPNNVAAVYTKWRSSSENIIKVDQEGNCTAVGTGPASIYCESFNPKVSSIENSKYVDFENYASKYIYVKERPSNNDSSAENNSGSNNNNDNNVDNSIPVRIALIVVDTKDRTLKVGEQRTYAVSLYPTNATNKSVIWKSSDTSIVSLKNEKNYAVTVTAEKVGKARVTVRAASGVSDYIDITVVDEDSENDQVTNSSLAKPKITSLKKGKKKFTVSWKKAPYVSGYELQYATDKKFKKNRKTVTYYDWNKTKATIKKLKSKKTYYVRIRTYKNMLGKTVRSKWSAVKKVKVK
jgi:uncharacterized protein YjdB